MNTALVSVLVAAVFLVLKMGVRYSDPDPKACIQDAGIVFLSGLAALYGYTHYLNKPAAPKVAGVFTEQPTF